MNDGGVMWVASVNLIIWTGLFLYLLSLERKVRRSELDRPNQLDRPSQLDRQREKDR